MSKNEVQISEAAGPQKEIDAAAAKTRIRRRVLPAADDRRGLRIFGQVPFVHESGGDPGAAYLVFLSELTPASRADDGNT